MAARLRNPVGKLIRAGKYTEASRALADMGYETSRGPISTDRSSYLRDLYGKPRAGRKKNSPHNVAERRRLAEFLQGRISEDKGIPDLSPEVLRVGSVPDKTGQLPKGARPLYREDIRQLLDRAQDKWGNNHNRDMAMAFYGDVLSIPTEGHPGGSDTFIELSDIEALDESPFSTRGWYTTRLPWGRIRQVAPIRRNPARAWYAPECYERANDRYEQVLAGLRGPRGISYTPQAAKEIRQQRADLRRLFAIFFAQEVTGIAWDEGEDAAIYCATIRPAKRQAGTGAS